jgi:transketolase
VILIATGSEVGVALEGKKLLEAKQIGTRVVSMPCWKLFREQPKSYREEVLPPFVKARLAIEAASPFGWREFVGDAGDILGIERFGASAPGKVVMKEYGFTAENVAARAEELLR